MQKSNHPLSPEWWRESIVYQIYPLSFQDTTGNGRGDLQGVIDRLDYLAGTPDSLGIDAIWLNPVHPSPQKDHGYDVMDYYSIDPVLGDLDTFDQLINQAGQRGIKIIMDYVLNHTSDRHPWFLESKSSQINPKADWYIWQDPAPDGREPNNWLSVFGGPAWSYVEERGQYYMHSFLPAQPDLNWRHPEVISEMKKVLKFWLDRGVAGFRADAIDHLFKDPTFRNEPVNPDHHPETDNPYDRLKHIYSRNQWPELKKLLRDICDNTLGREQKHFMITETWLTADELLEFHQISVYRQHLPFNFHMLHLPWRADQYRQFLNHYDGLLGMEHCPNFVYGNHDNLRVAGRLGRERARLAALMLLTLRGMPFIYYGDELGMENTPIPENRIRDPWEKRVPGHGLDRDPARTPMQWNAKEYAGFSNTEPWLPVSPDYQETNVEAEKKDPRSILSLYRSLIDLRRKYRALSNGYYHAPEVSDESVLAYIRENQTEKLLIVINFSDQELSTNLDLQTTDLKLSAIVDYQPIAKLLLSTHLDHQPEQLIDLKKITLRANEGLILELQKK